MLLRSRDGRTIELTVSLSQLKKLYVSLFRRLQETGAAGLDEIDEDDMLLTMQTFLQQRAAEQGVDCTIHSEWEAFLGMTDTPSCRQRLRQG